MKRRLLKSKNKNLKKFISIFIILSLFFLIIFGFIYVDKSLTPTIKILAKTKAEEIASQSVNKAVGAIIQDNIDYSDLILTKTDANGKISMLQSNTILMNQIASDVALKIQDEFKKVKTISSYIPIGTALGSPILAKYGPKIKVSIEPMGTVSVDFSTKFEDAGINQARHRIYLEVKSKINVVIPLSAESEEIKTQIPICETIIIGDVPKSYIESSDELNSFEY